jgi:hypothetical protein
MTQQEIFNRAAELLREGKTIHHFYRDIEGCRCVVGHFMTDEELDTLEKSSMLGRSVRYPDLLLPDLIKTNIKLFDRLQTVNDARLSPALLEEHLTKIAQDHNLTLEPAQ